MFGLNSAEGYCDFIYSYCELNVGVNRGSGEKARKALIFFKN